MLAGGLLELRNINNIPVKILYNIFLSFQSISSKSQPEKKKKRNIFSYVVNVVM